MSLLVLLSLVLSLASNMLNLMTVDHHRNTQIHTKSDRELNFADSFPVGTQLYCWNHLIDDPQWHLLNKCNCTTEKTSYFLMPLKVFKLIYLKLNLENLKANEMFTNSPKITKYFEENLIPSLRNHGSIWVLKAAGILSAEMGITNNSSESMNAVLHRLQKWKNVPLDVIAVSLGIPFRFVNFNCKHN